MDVQTQHSVQHSLDLYAHALDIIPGATQLISRRPDRYVAGVTPAYASHGKGAHFWDIDGNEYIDLVMSVGACLLGYADDEVNDAVTRQIQQGTVFSVSHPIEVELAEELIQTIPCAEMVRYARGGGEADAVAIRIARGYTGRQKVLFCGYHGWHDWYLAANLSSPNALNTHLLPGIEPQGVPAGLTDTVIPFEYNNLASLEAALEGQRGQVACIIMEAARGAALPQPGYLEGVRRLADQHGVVLIFDEVVTGFRRARRGAQEYFGVTPDIATYAKAISNGYAMGAVVGRREVMSVASDMFISSTYWSEAVGIAAALATIRAMKRRNTPANLAARGARFQADFNRLAQRHGLPAQCVGLPALLSLKFSPADPAQNKPLFTLFLQEMTHRGVFAGGGINVCEALTESDLDHVEAALDAVFPILVDALDHGDIQARLEGKVSTDAFRRLVG